MASANQLHRLEAEVAEVIGLYFPRAERSAGGWITKPGFVIAGMVQGGWLHVYYDMLPEVAAPEADQLRHLFAEFMIPFLAQRFGGGNVGFAVIPLKPRKSSAFGLMIRVPRSLW